jgi:hypothetical protein
MEEEKQPQKSSSTLKVPNSENTKFESYFEYYSSKNSGAP